MLQFYLGGTKKLDDAMAQSLGVILLALTPAQLGDINWTSDDITAAAGKVDSGADNAMVQHTTYLSSLSSYNILNYRLIPVFPLPTRVLLQQFVLLQCCDKTNHVFSSAI